MARQEKDSFVHLHNHTQFSLLDGASRIDEMIRQANDFGMPAVAITDHGNLYGVPRFFKKALECGVKPILGCEVYVAPGDRKDRSPVSGEMGGRPYYHLTVLAEDLTGYQNLMKLVSSGFLEGFYYRPRIDKELLARHSQGLIGLSGCLSGEIPQRIQNGFSDRARQAAGEYSEIFGPGNFFLEIQDHGIPEQKEVLKQTVDIGRRLDLPLVVTNDCHFLHRADHFAHNVLICIQTGKTVQDSSRMIYSPLHHFRSPQEMRADFAEFPDALDNTLRIAERCHCKLEFGRRYLPDFQVPDGLSLEEYFRKVVEDGYRDRLRQWESRTGGPSRDEAAYRRRLEEEVQMICQMGFPGYFLIVWDFVRFARENRIAVGPGRGSAAGSLVAYCLRITDIDPLLYGLLFERFLNPERVTLPDIDIDFCIKGRGKVIEYVTSKYGRENVAQIITFGTMAAKAVIRDVGRGLNISYGEVDRIAKMIPNDLDATVEGSLRSVPALRQAGEADERIAKLMEVAKRLEGLTRHASTHAAGVVISPRPLVEFTPLCRTKEHEVLTQYAMDDLESIGLLKMDFLGLKTLTLIDDTLQRIEAAGNRPIDLDTLPLDDRPTYELFSRAETSGIFQFESTGMKDILRKLKPDRFEDLIALNALYRPGPIKSGMIDEFIRRRRGGGKPQKLHPRLESILDETHGVIVYQEQVMRIANDLAGFSLGEADLLRRAMGKKKREVMSAQKVKFLAGARRNRIDESVARKVFELMANFAEYGFNKSHSTAYALIAYRTAYLKAHFPISFMAALLTSEKENTDNVAKYFRECREMGIPILPPDIHSSNVDFTEDRERIRFGLVAIRNVGENALRSILRARQAEGRFRDLSHLCSHCDLRLVNRRVLEALVKSGACDSFAGTRAQQFASIEHCIEFGQKEQEARESGQTRLFDLTGKGEDIPPPASAGSAAIWEEREVLAFEKEALGFYLSGHPLEDYSASLEQLATHTTQSAIDAEAGRKVVIGGMVTGLRRRKTKRGDIMAIFQLEDLEGTLEVILFPKSYQGCHSVLEREEPILVSGKAEEGSDKRRLIAENVVLLEGAEERRAASLDIRLTTTGLQEETVGKLEKLLAANPGECPLFFEVRHPRLYRLRIQAGHSRHVRPTRKLAESIEAILGKGTVRFRLRPEVGH